MVKVITIMDDIYTELYRMKKAKGMSFSEILRHLVKESEKDSRNLMSFAGSLDERDIDKKAFDSVRRGMGAWKRSV